MVLMLAVIGVVLFGVIVWAMARDLRDQETIRQRIKRLHDASEEIASQTRNGACEAIARDHNARRL